MDKFVRKIESSRRASGTASLFAPGNLEAETATPDRDAGIPQNDLTSDDIRKAAAALGVPNLLDS